MKPRTIHRAMGIPTTAIHRTDGTAREDAFFADGVLVRVMRTWLFALGLILGWRPHRGILIGRVNMDKRAPVVLMDWETYSKLLLGGFSPMKLPDVGMSGDVASLAREDDEHSETG